MMNLFEFRCTVSFFLERVGLFLLFFIISIIAHAKPYLALQSFQKGTFVLYMMDLDSRKVQKLTDLPGDRPRVSLDGKRVVFRAATGIIITGIGVMNTDGTNFLNITHDAFDEDPAWSPDGKRIAFSRSWKDIYVIHPNGTGLEKLTESPEIYHKTLRRWCFTLIHPGLTQTLLAMFLTQTSSQKHGVG